MFRANRSRSRRRRSSPGPTPVRDAYDWIILSVEAGGFLAVIGTLIFTILASRETSRDMAAAMSRMSTMANALVGQQGALSKQASAAEQQALATRQALGISNRLAGAAEQQAVASRDLSSAARAQTQIAAQSLRTERTAQLAFIVDPIEDLDPGKSPRARMRLVNNGNLAVTNVSIAGKILISFPYLGESPKMEQVFPDLDGPKAGRALSLAAGAEKSLIIAFERQLTSDDQVEFLRDGKVKIFIVGAARYRDANGVHIRRLCSEFWGDHLPEGRECLTAPER